MGFTSFLKKKVADTPEKQVERTALKLHKAKVKEAYDIAFREAELESAKTQAKLDGTKAGAIGKKKGSLLKTIGNVAEGMVYGVNKGADAFNQGVGLQNFNLEVPKQNEQITIPRGNNDIFYGSVNQYDEPSLRKKKKHRNELFDSY